MTSPTGGGGSPKWDEMGWGRGVLVLGHGGGGVDEEGTSQGCVCGGGGLKG